MKILHVIPSLHIGGTEKMLTELCRNLNAREFQHSVVALKGGGAAADELARLGVPVILLESPNGLAGGALDFPRLILRLRGEILKQRPALVHTWLSRANIAGRFSAIGTGVPVVSSLRVMEEEKAFHIWAERLTHRWCKTVTVNCTALSWFAERRIGLPKEKIALIPNGIRIPGPVPRAAALSDLRKRWIPDGDIAVGTVGRLHRQKGMDVFLDAAKIILKTEPRCRFLIAGDGPEMSALKERAERLDISPRVAFCGWVRESAEFLSMLDVFVLASRWEGMPNVVMEAMLLGKPIAATSVGGTTDLIHSGTEGLLVPSENAAALAEAVLRLLQFKDDRERMALAARAKIESEFSFQKMAEAHGKLYETFV